MENETAADVVQGTPGDHQEDQTVDNEVLSPSNIKEVDGRMKLAISALIRSSLSSDSELRERSAQSLSRVARLQPLTVLSEWLAVLSSEREKAGSAVTAKKKSSDSSTDEAMSG